MLRGAFVTGTDTGVGKTVVAACLCAALREQGLRVAAAKPVVTGLDEPEPGRPPDHEVLAAAAGVAPSAVAGELFGPAVSPHLAAELEDRPLERAALVRQVKEAAVEADIVVVEGAGGLLVPLATSPEPYLMRDLARDLELPVIVAARPGLGTINHTLLTIEAARNAHLDVLGVVLTPWPIKPSAIERSNRTTIEALGRVPVVTLHHVGLRQDELAAAGESLAHLLTR